MKSYSLLGVLLLCCAPFLGIAQRGYTATGPSPCNAPAAATAIEPNSVVYVKGWSGTYEPMIYRGKNLPAPWGETVEHYIHKPDNVNSLYSLPDGARLGDYVISEAAYQALDPTQGPCAACCTANYTAVFKAELLELINDYRHANGKSPLRFDPVLDEAAQDYAEVGAADPRRALANMHEADGTTPQQRILRVARKYDYPIRQNGGKDQPFAGPTGENVVVFGEYCAQDAFERWKKSPPHDWQMKFEGHRYLGIGVACGVRESGGTFLFAVNKFAPAKWEENDAPLPTAAETTPDPIITTPATPDPAVAASPTAPPAAADGAPVATGGYTATGDSPCDAPPKTANFKENDIIYVRNFSGDYDRMIYGGANKQTAWGVLEHYIYEPGDPDAIMLMPAGVNLAERALSEADYRALQNGNSNVCATCCTADYAAIFKGDLLRTLNAYRKANGAGPLAYDAALDLAAQRYADFAVKNPAKTQMNQHFADDRSPDDRMLEAAKELSYVVKDMGGFELPYDGKMGENAVIFNKMCAEQAFATWKGSPGHDRQMKNKEHRLIGIGVACGVKADGKPFIFAVNKFAHQKWPAADEGTTPPLPTPAETTSDPIITTTGPGTTPTPTSDPVVTVNPSETPTTSPTGTPDTTTGGYTATGNSPCDAPPKTANFKENDIIYVRNFSGDYDRMIYGGANKQTAWGVLEHYIYEPGDPDAIMLMPAGVNLAERALSEADYRALQNGNSNVCATCCTADYAAIFKGDLLRTLNAYRKANGAGPLAYDAALDLAAQRYADFAVKNPAKTQMNQHFADDRSPDDRMLEAAKELSYVVKDMGGFELPYDGKMGENAVIFNKMCAEQAFATWKGSPGHDRQMKNKEHRLIGIGVACGVKADGKPFIFAVNKFAHQKWPAVEGSETTSAPIPAENESTDPTGTNTGAVTARGGETSGVSAPATPATGDCTEVENYTVWYEGRMERYNRLPEGTGVVSTNRKYALVVTRDGELLIARVGQAYQQGDELQVQTCAAVWRAPLQAVEGGANARNELRVSADYRMCFGNQAAKGWCADGIAQRNAQLYLDDFGQLSLYDQNGQPVWTVGGEQ